MIHTNSTDIEIQIITIDKKMFRLPFLFIITIMFSLHLANAISFFGSKTNTCVKTYNQNKVKGGTISGECVTQKVCEKLTPLPKQCKDSPNFTMSKKRCTEYYTHTREIIPQCEAFIKPTDLEKLENWCDKQPTLVKKRLWHKFLGKNKVQLPPECPPSDNVEFINWCKVQANIGRTDPKAGTNIRFIGERCKLVNAGHNGPATDLTSHKNNVDLDAGNGELTSGAE